jgi:hypothetical protein
LNQPVPIRHDRFSYFHGSSPRSDAGNIDKNQILFLRKS